jgi:hypothetical protein
MPKTRSRKSIVLISLLRFSLLLCAYLIGAYSYSRNIWPIESIRQIKRSSPIAAVPRFGSYDSFGRLIAFPNKIQVKCPIQKEDTAILLVIGQSNSANHAETKISTQYPQNVLNYFEDKCYIAASPLLGATGEEGEFITPLADTLIANRTYESVIIISSGIDSTPIARWQKDGDLNEMLITIIKNIKNTYKITDIIWHQGESDFINSTSAKVYVKSFNSLLRTLADVNVIAPSFISISTKCGFSRKWNAENPTATGQQRLIDNKKIFLGANTDLLLETNDRRRGACHFSGSGQTKTASAFADSIKKAHY